MSLSQSEVRGTVSDTTAAAANPPRFCPHWSCSSQSLTRFTMHLLLAFLLILSLLSPLSASSSSSRSSASSHPHSRLFTSHKVDVASLPGLSITPAQLLLEHHHVGYLPVDSHSRSRLFYYLVRARHNASSAPAGSVVQRRAGLCVDSGSAAGARPIQPARQQQWQQPAVARAAAPRAVRAAVQRVQLVQPRQHAVHRPAHRSRLQRVRPQARASCPAVRETSPARCTSLCRTSCTSTTRS